MDSLRKWFYRPKKDDTSLLAQFFYADEALNIIANELDSFDGRKDPERCTTLVNQLRQSQDKVLTITNSIMDILLGDERANRDFRVKFPEDVLQENLAGQLWFGAECLAAGSSIMNREAESVLMRPLAKAVTKSLEHVRNLLRQACLRNNTPNGPLKLDNNELVTEILVESLKIFDNLFAEFELAYVSAMVPVKSTKEYELQEMIGVLFSETLQRALKIKLLFQDMVDYCDPALMFTIPRLAIVRGLLAPNGSPLYVDKVPEDMSEMFRPFRTLLHRIRELLWTLTKKELYMLEKLLCDNEDFSDVKSVSIDFADLEGSSEDFAGNYYQDLYGFEVDINPEHRKASLSHEVTPSTSTGFLIPNTVSHDSIMALRSPQSPNQPNHQSPPDQDSLQVIAVAAVTLSSYLAHDEVSTITGMQWEFRDKSADDSGISTETTSLDRSPTMDSDPNTRSCKCGLSNSRCACKRKRDLKRITNCFGTSGSCRDKVLAERRTLSQRKKDSPKRETVLLDDDSSSSDTSSFNSMCAEPEEIAMAMQAAAISSREEIRSKYRSSEDLLHRLFVCIAGVADQLQTNFASDLRNILKAVFLINASDANGDSNEGSDQQLHTTQDIMSDPVQPCLESAPSSTSSSASMEYRPAAADIESSNEFTVDPNILAQEALFDTNVYFHLEGDSQQEDYTNSSRQQRIINREDMLSQGLCRMASLERERRPEETPESPPVWIPDVEAPKCMSCGANFTVVKRRHHCRNCGKIFCARCSSNNVPLPKFGHNKPVRVCNKCFIYNLTPFTMCE